MGEEAPEATRSRKIRRDKGSRLLTPRDMWALRWTADQYAIRLDQLRVLLSREPGKGQQGLSMSAAHQVVSRWRQEPALVEYERFFTHEPGWVWLTPHTERLLELPYAPYHLRTSRLVHRYFINAVRLDVEARHPEYIWTSERALLTGQRREAGGTLSHTPDAEIQRGDGRIAVEVELTPKQDEQLDAILQELLVGAHYIGAWYFVSSQDTVCKHAWRAISTARERLSDDLQRRMQIIDLSQLERK